MKNLISLIFLSMIFCSALSAQEKDKRTIENFKKNNLSIMPLMMNTGLGFGLQYERYLDKNNNFSFTLPAQMILASLDANLMFTDYDRVNMDYGYFSREDRQLGFALNPGVRLYFVEPRRFNWFIGMSFLYNYLNVKGDYFIHKYNNVYREDFIFKNLINNSFSTLINMGFKGTVNEKITFQVELGNGVRYIDRTKLINEVDGKEELRLASQISYNFNISVGFGVLF